MVERESLTANVAPGGARNTAEMPNTWSVSGAVEVVDPREYKKLQCCKNLFTR
jgi:hypothetical protein